MAYCFGSRLAGSRRYAHWELVGPPIAQDDVLKVKSSEEARRRVCADLQKPFACWEQSSPFELGKNLKCCSSISRFSSRAVYTRPRLSRPYRRRLRGNLQIPTHYMYSVFFLYPININPSSIIMHHDGAPSRFHITITLTAHDQYPDLTPASSDSSRKRGRISNPWKVGEMGVPVSGCPLIAVVLASPFPLKSPESFDRR